MRYREATRQAAILNALPAQIVLLNANGVITSVNDAWKAAAANGLADGAHGIGLNYLAVCDGAFGTDAASAHAVAAGIRSVLSGENKRLFRRIPL
jgi:PAS domain-containing protein